MNPSIMSLIAAVIFCLTAAAAPTFAADYKVGIAAREIIDFTHWLGAVNTNPVIIGNAETPVRWVIERAASFVDVPRTCMAFVVGPSSQGICPADAGGEEPGLMMMTVTMPTIRCVCMCGARRPMCR